MKLPSDNLTLQLVPGSWCTPHGHKGILSFDNQPYAKLVSRAMFDINSGSVLYVQRITIRNTQLDCLRLQKEPTQTRSTGRPSSSTPYTVSFKLRLPVNKPIRLGSIGPSLIRSKYNCENLFPNKLGSRIKLC